MTNKIVNLILVFFTLTFGVLNSSYSQNNFVTREQLVDFNRVEMPAYTDTCNLNNGLPFKILIIGNSLTHHNISEKIGWDHVSGMAASSIDKDYVHILYRKIERVLPENKICMRVSNLASFERNFHAYNFHGLDSLVSFKPDLIILQLGENVSLDTIKTSKIFEERYIDLIKYLKNERSLIVVCTTSFFPSQSMNEAVKNVVCQTNSFLVDLSNLVLLDKRNFAKNELDYPADKSKWKVGGIGVHPGDFGMENIATQIFLTINAILASFPN